MFRELQRLGVLVAFALGVSCAGNNPPPDQPGFVPADPSDAAASLQAEIVMQLGHLDPAEREPLIALAGELAADWLREAGHDAYAGAILDLQRSEFIANMNLRDYDQRREFLRAEVYDRRARAIGRRSFELGKQVVDHAIAPADAQAAGRALLDELAALTRLVQALRDCERVRVLSVELQESSLEALYAVEGGAMSHRLSLYAADKKASPVSPPDVEPVSPPDVEP